MGFMNRAFWMGSFVVAMWSSAAIAQSTLPSDFSVDQPTIPEREFSISKFGAVGDGKTFNTEAIARAISACEKAGGGTVDVPPGKFLTGPVRLGSKLNLHLEKGSTILFSNNPKDYASEDGSFHECMEVQDGEDIAITGQGTIDGQGAFFWRQFEEARNGGGESGDVRRPRLIQFTRCSRVLVQDVTLTNSPSFHLVPGQCQNVTIEGVHIKSPMISPNTDGIDPSGINFLISRCTIDTGDDCIAVKASSQYDPDRPACENFLITDCMFLHGHGMSVGSETYGGVRNMVVRNCMFDGTDAGIRLKSGRGRGGLLEDVTYEHLIMRNVKNSILITSYYPKVPSHPERDVAQTVGRRTPQWRHILISDVTSTDSLNAGQIVGLPEMPIEDIEFSNVKIFSVGPIEIVHAKSIKFINCKLSASGKPVILDSSVEGLN
jgi:polygalacturonase